jgi:hypothetical protein
LAYSSILKDVAYKFKNLKNLIFVTKNWLNDPKVGCKSFCNLVEFIETNKHLEKKFKKIEGEFE